LHPDGIGRNGRGLTWRTAQDLRRTSPCRRSSRSSTSSRCTGCCPRPSPGQTASHKRRLFSSQVPPDDSLNDVTQRDPSPYTPTTVAAERRPVTVRAHLASPSFEQFLT